MTWAHIIELAIPTRRVLCGERRSCPSFLTLNYSGMTTKAPVMRYIRIDTDPARIFFAHGTVQILHGKRGVISMAGIAKWRLA
jgi:hypothetical protein